MELDLPSATFIPAATEEDWLALRNTGIGGSDVGAILGISPYTSPYALWAEKTGRAPRRAVGAAAKWGHLLEGPIADDFAEKESKRLLELPKGLYRSAKLPFALATPDRLVISSDELSPAVLVDVARGLLEVKTAGMRVAHHWDAGPPLHYQAQLAWYQWVTGLDEGWIAVLIGGQDDRSYEMPYDHALDEVFESAATDFWHNVTEGTPPPIDGHASTSAALGAVFAKSKDEKVALDHLVEALAERRRLAGEVKEHEARIDEIDNEVKATMGTATLGTLSGEKAVTWRPSTTSRIDVTALRADLPEVAERYTKVSESRRFVVC